MIESFALPDINNLAQRSGTALHPGKTPDGAVFLMFLAAQQLVAEQASIPSATFPPDSNGDVLKALGNGRKIDLTEVTIAPVEKSTKLDYVKKAPHSILNGRTQHPASSTKYPASSIQHQVSSIQHQASSIQHPASSIQQPQITDYGSRTTGYGLRTTDYGLRITDHYATILPKAPAEEQIPYVNPKSDTSDLWAKGAGNVEGKKLGDGIIFVKYRSGYTEGNPEVSVQVRGASGAYSPLETEHAPRVDANQVKASVQIQRVIYVSNGSGRPEQQKISDMGERPVINNATYSRSGSLADEVIKMPIREDNPGSSELQQTIKPGNQIALSVDRRQITRLISGEQGLPEPSPRNNGLRYSNVSWSASQVASVAEKVQELQPQKTIPQTPREYVPIEDDVQEIQPELVAEEKVDTIHQPLWREIITQNVQRQGRHPQVNDQVRVGTRQEAAPLDAFEVASVAQKVEESQLQKTTPQTPRGYVPIEDNIQKVQPELVAEEKVDTIHQPLRQEIITQSVQDYRRHLELNDEAKVEARYEAAPSNVFEGTSVAQKVQESQLQEIIPEISQETVRIGNDVQEIQPELVAEEKTESVHQPLRQEIITQSVQDYGRHLEVNNEAKIGTRHEAAPSDSFEGSPVAEVVQESQPQKTIPQTPREYIRIEGNIQDTQPKPVAQNNVGRIYQPLRQEVGPQDVQEYGRHLELNDDAKIETRYVAASPDAFEHASVAEKVQKSQPQEIILQPVQQSVRAKDDVQQIQPELSRGKETGRIHQSTHQAVSSQDLQEYGKHLEHRVESQLFGREIQAASSMPELPGKIPFYVSKMVAGERSEAIWIQLEPEHLGKVKLRILHRDNRISVNLSVDRPQTRGIIEAQIPDIRMSLAQHEIEIAEFRVSLENGFSNSNPRYSNLLHDNANTDSRPAYDRGDWNRNQSEHSNRRRYYRSDSLVDLLA